jgi:RNA exonuclease NGL2
MSSSSNAAPSPPPINWNDYRPKCTWLEVPNSTKTRFLKDGLVEPSKASNLVNILSFNILAQTLIRRDVFPTSSKSALKWGTRRNNLFQEIQIYGADILCLQECDFYDEFWKPQVVENPELNFGGGIWKRKEGNRGDGVAVIWNARQFDLAAQESFEYDDFCKLEPYANEGQGSDLTELLRGNVAQIVALRRRSASSEHSGPVLDEGIILFNTHLFWNPKYNFVRLAQVVIALEQIMKFKSSTGLNWPVVMCGDYNHSSGDASYEALFEREGLTEIWHRHPHWLAPKLHYSKYQAWIVPPAQEILDKESPQPAAPQNEQEIERRFAFVKSLLERLESHELPAPISIYRNYKEVDPDHPDWEDTNQPSRLEPPFTSYSSYWCGPLDYIAVMPPDHEISSKDTCRLLPHKLLRIPRATEIGPPSSEINSKRIPNPVALPNDVRASDHIPIMVSFSLEPIIRQQ